MLPQWQELITGIANIEFTNITDRGEGVLSVEAVFKGRRQCRHCGSLQVRLKDDYFRTLKHSRTGNRLMILRVRVFKVFCRFCRKYSVSQIPGVLPRRHATETFRREVFEDHHGGHSLAHLARSARIGLATVERWYQDFILYRVKEMQSRPCPKVLGIDEHFFSKKHGYATSLIDLKNGHVFDVVLGRSEASLRRYLSGLKGRERVKLVVMDLSETYRAIVRKYFPQAKIVSDRFHVIRLVNLTFQRVWQLIDPKGKKNRGLLCLMRRHPWNLSDEQQKKLLTYLQTYPGLQSIYQAREKLLRLLLHKQEDKARIRVHVHNLLEFIRSLKESAFDHFKTLGHTLDQWQEEIGRMWRVHYSNAITEGFHTKMEMISRRAFGFRNFNNYRLRVIALCGWNGLSKRYQRASKMIAAP